MKNRIIEYEFAEEPKKDCPLEHIVITQKTIDERLAKLLRKMEESKIDQLLIYADVEHGSNFEYLVGFFPRFEEGLLLLNKDGSATLLLANENFNKVSKSRISAKGELATVLSLPNQPSYNDKKFSELLQDAGIKKNSSVGLVGWKNFSSRYVKNEASFDLPHFIVEAVYEIVEHKKNVKNCTYFFIGNNGIRTTNNANEIAYFELGASLASDCMLDAMNSLKEGISEFEVADKLVRYGQHTNVVTIAAFGERFMHANMFPTDNTLKKDDTVSLTVSYRGGLSSRSGYASDNLNKHEDYLNDLVIPYFNAYTTWLEEIKIGMKGKDLYNKIENVLPKERYGWQLCPGHLTAYEEWMSSPIYEESNETLKSGMILQVDFIPIVPGYPGVSAESTVVLADKKLRETIKNEYPEMMERMLQRKDYIENVIGINLSEDILPMCSTVGYLRPLLLIKERILKVRRK